MASVGQMLIFSGAVLIVLGVIFLGKLGPLGRLPGDLLFNKAGFTFYFPITTIVLINVLVAVVLWFVGKH